MIQVYTGNGKGKTTAAIGLALRAVGAGMNVYIAQFVKGGCYSEIRALKKIRGIKVEQFGRNCFIKKVPEEEDCRLAAKGLEKVKKVIAQKKYRLVILDEINIALKFKLIPLSVVLDLIRRMPRGSELVLTGRYAHPRIMESADLVSEVKERKHYYRNGLKARKGIEF
ncbi:MAG: cob(I)yrinic acid a,c-diamide adenosyltransferase [Candidatus Omnitrophica bacterium]|nr:cob(I)yrinic acid a,c-diamide adenosyltransferase [Candidatus Omnitrophota bacterium]MDD5770811.1 cob(I)yrinic acid a,c-diamide adenosyltransferase [Candidatus Omnitrophota bacterium]